MKVNLLLGDCVARMSEMPEGSVGAVVSDPPYGLEFMGKEWDKLDGTVLHDPSVVGGFQDGAGGNPFSRSRIRYGRRAKWEDGGGFSAPGIGERFTAWPSFSATSKHGMANPTCAVCGGRLRGAKKCECPKPHDHWKPIGKRKNPENEGLPDHLTGTGMTSHLNAMQEWHVAWLREVYRVLVPGGVLKAFSGTRTFHRLAGAMQEAGFTDLSVEAWSYGSGFPKSHNTAVYADRILTEGRSRNIVRHGVGNLNGRFAEAADGFVSQSKAHTVTTDEARRWDGWGTALKPAWEPFIVGKKPG